MTTVLLTGAAGFLGRAVLPALLRRGYAVHAIDRKHITGIDANGVTWHATDLLDRWSTLELMEAIRPEGFIHLAWDTAHGNYWNSQSNLQWLAASLLMLHDFSRLGGKRVVIAGSCAEYQWGGADLLDELNSPLIPDSLYGTSKNALREVISKWASDAGVSWAWGRFFNVFGPNEKPVRLLPKVIRTLLDAKALPFDSGAVIRDFMHVTDVGDALTALFHTDVQGPVNIASGQALRVREVISSLAAYLQASECVFFDSQTDQPGQPASIVARVDRLRDEVGWQPQVSLMERMHETCDWWRLAKDSNF